MNRTLEHTNFQLAKLSFNYEGVGEGGWEGCKIFICKRFLYAAPAANNFWARFVRQQSLTTTVVQIFRLSKQTISRDENLQCAVETS